MVLSPHDMETLIDLVENKLSDMLILDGDDRRTAASLERCLGALYAMKGADRAPMGAGQPSSEAVYAAAGIEVPFR